MLINPAGKVLPCHCPEVIPGLEFENVREQTLSSSGSSPLRSSVSRRRMDAGTLPQLRPAAQDFGGCRCQALLLTGDAAATDPACSLAPRITSSRQRWSKPIRALRFRTQFPPRHSCNCRSAPEVSGVIEPIRSNQNE